MPAPSARLPLVRPLALGLLGLGLVGALAGCAADSGTGSGTGGSASGGSGSSSSGSGSYKDGDYSASGDYQSPGGQESIDVTVTLADNVVTAVSVTPHASSGNAKQYQTQFASGISDEVVGKKLDELDVTRVSGSSLTSGGFDKAIAEIKQLAELNS